MAKIINTKLQVWKEIITDNKTEIIKALLLYRNNLDDVIRKIKKDESLDQLFKDSFRSYTCL